MKRWLLGVFIAFAGVCAMTAVSFADVQGSHHDLNTFTSGALAGQDTCYPCHGYRDQSTGTIAELGRVGSLCYLRCHQGTGAAGDISTWAATYPAVGTFGTDNNMAESVAYSTAVTVRDKYATGHLMTRTNIPAPDTTGSWPTWPYIDQTTIECTTCHDVHTNTYTPFIRANLSDNSARASAFCHQCHRATANGSARWVDMETTAPNGSHPSEADHMNATSRTTLTRLNRTIGFKDVVNGTTDNVAVFRNVSANGTALNLASRHYLGGGKLGDFGTGGNVGCYSCHATHLPAGVNGATGSIGIGSQLAVAPWKGFRARNQSDMCVGCHGAGSTDGRNPGTTAYFHPVNGEAIAVDNTTETAAVYTVTAGNFNIVVNVAGTDMGANSRVVCSSCHGDTTTGRLRGVHYGPADTMLLNPNRSTCASCHNVAAVNLGTAPNSHHVYGGGSARGASYTNWGYPDNVYFNTTARAGLSDGLSCDDCHTFNGTAHNWN